MHPNQAFRGETDERNLQFAKQRGFGTIAISTTGAPMFSHVPFVVADDSTYVELHLVRSNPMARSLDTPQPAKLSIQGPDSYVSPDWYGMADQVPTWNYVAVHLTGTLTALPDTELAGILERESAFFEQKLTPKEPWVMDKVEPDALSKMMRAIMPCRLEIETVDGTWKLNQNKPKDVRNRAAVQIANAGLGTETESLARYQREAAGPEG